jgi:hypothetical protein
MSRVEIYFHFRKKIFSLRQRGKVFGYAPCILIRDPRFVVQEGGRNRVLREKRKNVHAFVVATTREQVSPNRGDMPPESGWTHRVYYNPYRGSEFMAQEISSEPKTPNPIQGAASALLQVGDNGTEILVKEPNQQETI